MNNKGFTLVEFIVSMVVLFILCLVAYDNFNNSINTAIFKEGICDYEYLINNYSGKKMRTSEDHILIINSGSIVSMKGDIVETIIEDKYKNVCVAYFKNKNLNTNGDILFLNDLNDNK